MVGFGVLVSNIHSRCRISGNGGMLWNPVNTGSFTCFRHQFSTLTVPWFLLPVNFWGIKKRPNSWYVSCPPHMLRNFTWELKICHMLPCKLQIVVFGWFCMGWMTSFEWQPLLSHAEAQENEDIPTWKARFQARKVDWSFSSKLVKNWKAPTTTHFKASGWFEITVVLALTTANCQVRKCLWSNMTTCQRNANL